MCCLFVARFMLHGLLSKNPNISLYFQGANVHLIKKFFFPGSKQTVSFIEAIMQVAAKHPKHDLLQRICLRCCNNLIFLEGSRHRIAYEAPQLLIAFASAIFVDHHDTRDELALLVRNIATLLFLKEPGTLTEQASTIIGISLTIILSAPLSAASAVENAILALGTCVHSSATARKSAAFEKASEALGRVTHVFIDGNPRHGTIRALARETLEYIGRS